MSYTASFLAFTNSTTQLLPMARYLTSYCTAYLSSGSCIFYPRAARRFNNLPYLLITPFGSSDDEVWSRKGNSFISSTDMLIISLQVFCYPCVLHYLNASSETQNWARCPICFDAINEKQLKSVRWYDEPSIQDETMDMPQEASSSSSHVDNNEGDSPRPGSTLRMRLMERPQITTLALPRSATWPSDLIPKHQAPFHFLPDVFRFARFMLATPSYLLAHLSLDLDELSCERRVLSGMKDELSVAFVDTAERKVRQQMEKAAALDTEALKSATARAEQGVRDLERDRGRDERKREQPSKVDQETDNPDNVPAEFLSTQGIIPISASSKPTSVTRNQRRRQNINPPPPSQSAYYFYQAASGASIFLHPLDIRILLSHFGGYSAFPDTIAARVDASSEGAVDADLRRRCKYLGHMPESADVVFVEADLTSVVGEEALRAFEAPLRARRTKRRERGKKDDRARARAEERERAKMRLPPSWALPQPDSAGSAVDYGLLVSMAEAAFERPATPEEITVDASAPAPAAAAMSTSTPTGGAWGVRTFASAARSPQPQTPIRGQQARGSQGRGQQSARRAELNTDDIDDWEFDAAWHELEAGRATVGGGRRKRANKLVVLGGGGGRRR